MIKFEHNISHILQNNDIKYLGSGENGDAFKTYIDGIGELNIKFTQSKSEFECTKLLQKLQFKTKTTTDFTSIIYFAERVNKEIIEAIPNYMYADMKHKPKYVIIKEYVFSDIRISKYVAWTLFAPITKFCKTNGIDFETFMEDEEIQNDFWNEISQRIKMSSVLEDIIALIRIMGIFKSIKADDLHSHNIGRDIFTNKLKAFDFDQL